MSDDRIAFFDAAPSGIPADDYTVTVTQSVVLDSAYGPPSQPFQDVRPLTVSGPQLGMDPGDLVTAFPPPGSQADWSSVLPHAVLARPTLPWEVPAQGAAAGSQTTPWMALLLLSLDPVPGTGAQEIVVAEGSTPSATGTHTVALADYLAPPAGVAGPVFADAYASRLEADSPDLRCVVVDVEVGAFAAIAPQLAELPLLAHVREAAQGWFSVVVANRLPGKAGGRFAAHLVSLQGFTTYLPGQAGPPAGTTAIRLLSLESWAFESLPEGPDFLWLMKALDRDALRLPAPPEGSVASDALAAGYAGLPYGTRTGEHTTAWYRGPLHPVPMERDLQPPFGSADAALVYDPQTGMLDASFAAAWQLGRLLALANRTFATAYGAWVRESLNRAYLLAERLAYFRGAERGRGVGRLAERLAALGVPRVDPSRLRDRLHRVPGVLDPAVLERASAAGGDPHDAVRDHLGSRDRR